MIESITLRNFQAHKALTVDLDPRVTTIVGRTDAGKSAVVRALRWAALNKPNGAAFVRHGRKFCKVTLKVDGVRLVRKRKGAKGEYRIGKKSYKAFGAAVPKPVAVLIDLTEDNFQKQMDAPYWLAMGPGELSKALNDVVDLSLIDDAAKSIGAEARQAYAEVRVIKDRYREACADRRRLRPCLEMDGDLRKVEALAEEVEEIKGKAERLREALSLARSLRRKRGRLSERAEALERGERACSALDSAAREARGKAKRLRELIAEAAEYLLSRDAAEADLREAETELEAFKECPTCGTIISRS